MIERELLVAHYCRERTLERRNQVVDAYRHLCTRGARKFKRGHNDRADLEQVAAIGLIKAAVNYRAEMQTPFQAYAWIMVVGELMHYVRDHERLIRAPRSLVALERRYAETSETLTATLQREPTAMELAEAIGVSLETIAELRSLRRVQHVPLPVRDSLEGSERPELQAPQVGVGLEERIALTIAVEELAERERAIVLGTYGAGLTQQELGQRLGLSQSHVSKLLARALHKLRKAA